MSTPTHPQRDPISDAAFAYIDQNNWTIVAVGLNKKPLGDWGPGSRNRYDYTNTELVYQLNAPGLGVITGPSGLVIIDLDNETAIRTWATQFGTPLTRIVKTPRGRHLYYKAPPGIHIPPGTEILPGVDVRGGESYAILPPSILANGEYTWLNQNPIQQLPDNVLDLIKKHKPERKKKILSGEAFAEGTRNDHLFTMAQSMRAAGFDYTSILSAISETNKTRCVPPLDADEVQSIAESAVSYEPASASHVDTLALLRSRQASRDHDDEPVLAEYAKHLDTRLLVTTNPPRIDWIWEGFLAPGTLSMLHGEGGLGKSWIALKIAEQMLLDQPGRLFDKPITQGSVIILDGENAEVQIHSRINHTQIAEDSPLHYYVVTDAILGLEELTDAYIQHLITQHEPRLIIIDSQRALWSGDEKEQAEAGRMLRRFARSIETYDCAFLIIHHDNRGGDYSGSSDINAAVSGCRLHLKRHTDKDKPHARILTQPKNRIAAEMPRQEFVLDITQLPATHRASMSGIKIAPYVSDETTKRQDRLSQAMTLALNTPDGVSYRDLWSAVDFGFDESGVSSTDEHRWADLKADLEAQGFTLELRGQAGGWVVKR